MKWDAMFLFWAPQYKKKKKEMELLDRENPVKSQFVIRLLVSDTNDTWPAHTKCTIE